MTTPWTGGRGPYCPHCRQRTVPVPYFSRGINVGKAAFLFLLTPAAPLVFFFLRRDRAVCSWCRSMLPGEVDVPLLDTFSPTPLSPRQAQQLLEEGSPGGALESSSEGTQREIAIHEHKGRRSARRVSTMGTAAVVFAGLGGWVASNEGAAAAAYLWTLGGLSGAVAFASARRGQRHNIAAQITRQRHRVLEILNLAKANAGKLTVTAVAAHMQLDLRESEALLDSMVDGRRIDVQVDDGGRITYVFPELIG